MVINRVNAEIIVDDDGLRNLGFTKVSTINRNIIINFGDGRPTILSKFNIDDLESSLKSLQKKLINNSISEESAQRLSVFLADKLVKIIEQGLQNEGSAAYDTDVQKITQEIAKDKVAIGQISVEQWQSGVLERYQILQKVVQENLPNLWPALEFSLFTISKRQLQDSSNLIFWIVESMHTHIMLDNDFHSISATIYQSMIIQFLCLKNSTSICIYECVSESD